jgi:hypothetical protein
MLSASFTEMAVPEGRVGSVRIPAREAEKVNERHSPRARDFMVTSRQGRRSEPREQVPGMGRVYAEFSHNSDY